MAPRVAALLFVVAACGRIGFDAEPLVTVDAPRDASSVDAPPCASFGAWSTPVAIPELNGTTDDQGPAISPDGLTIYFQSFRSDGLGASDLYRAARSSPTGTFGTPEHLPVLSSASDDRDITIGRGGTRVYVNSNRGGMNRTYYADLVGGAFMAPVLVPELDGGYGPWISDDELDAVISRGGGLQLYMRSSPTATWIDLGPMTTVNSPQNDGFAGIGADFRELVFESDRTGTPSIFSALRTMRGLAFGAPSSVSELNTLGGQSDPDLSSDGRTIYFSSNRSGAQYDIYVATRACN